MSGCATEDDLCSGCGACGKDEVESLEGKGHTYHCACRMVWGDGQCECGKEGWGGSSHYLGSEWYLENFIIADTKENYRVNSFWHYWRYRGLLPAISGDARIVADFGILDSESF